MRDFFEAVYNSLQEEEKILKQLISTTQDLAEAFQENNLTDIMKLTEKQSTLTSHLQVLFKERCLIQEKLKTMLGLPIEATLNDILTIGADDKEGLFKKVISGVKKQILVLSPIVFTNCLLMKQAIDFNRKMLGLLCPENKPIYREEGRLEGIKAITVLNRMV